MKRTALRRLSPRRLLETDLYRFRARQFLLKHPYCQVWLAEHALTETTLIATGGTITRPDQPPLIAPLATQVHHRNKRRGADLLDETEWLAVSASAHTHLETHKSWARARSYLRDF